jgi:RNA polymerase sigma factor (sigma-70 family)
MPKEPLPAVLDFLDKVCAPRELLGLPDGALLERFLATRDETAFALLVERHGPMVLSLCRRVLGDATNAEDAFQATFLVLARRAASVRKGAPLANWLYGVAQRVAHNARARTAARLSRQRELCDMPREQLDELTWQELRPVLDDEISRLPENCRAAIVLCYFEGKSYDQAAQELGWAKSTLASRLARARELLRQRLVKRGIAMSTAALTTALTEKSARAAVAALLTLRTAKAAAGFAASQTVPGAVVSARAIALAEETMKGMTAIKVKFALAILACCLSLGVAVAAYRGLGDSRLNEVAPPPNSAEAPPQDKVALDFYGDPLPPGAVARLGSLRWFHEGRVDFAAFVADGKTVVTTTPDDKTLHVWEYPSGKEIRRVHLPTNPFETALTRDGKTFASHSSLLTSIYLYDLANGKELPGLKWEYQGTGKYQARGMTFSPDGRHLAILETGGTVRIWDWAKADEVKKFPVDPKWSPFLAYAPDGASLATIADGQVQLWDPATGTPLGGSLGDTTTMGSIYSVLYSPDGKTLAVRSKQGLFLVATATGKDIRQLPVKLGPKGAGLMVFNQDGSRLYSFSVLAGYVDNTTDTDVEPMEWDVATGKLLRAQAATRGLFVTNTKTLLLSPDGNTLIGSGNGRRPGFLDLNAGKDIVALKGPATATLSSLQFTPEHTGLLITGLEKWDAATGKYLGRLSFPASTTRIAVSPDAKFLAGLVLQGKESGKVHIVEAASGKTLAKVAVQGPFSAKKGPFSAETWGNLRFSPNGKVLAIWQGAKRRIELYDAATAQLLSTCDTGPGHPPDTSVMRSTIIFSADGKALVHCEALASQGPISPMAIAMFDTTSGKQTGGLQLPSVSRAAEQEIAALSSDGRCLALDRRDGTVALYELASAKPRGFYGTKLPQKEKGKKGKGLPDSPTSSFALSVDGKSIAQSCQHGIVHVWDVMTGRELADFKGHTGTVTSVAFAPDGKTLASVSADHTGLIWDVAKIARPPLPIKALQVADLEQHWQVLAEQDAEKAWTAMTDLLAAPKDAVLFLQSRLKPASPPDLKQVEVLIRRLDDDDFKVRKPANEELLQLGEQIVPALDKALAANPRLETKLRLEELRNNLTSAVLHGDRLRAYRAVEVLELIGTPEARQVLQALAKGAPDALLTKSARSALNR